MVINKLKTARVTRGVLWTPDPFWGLALLELVEPEWVVGCLVVELVLFEVVVRVPLVVLLFVEGVGLVVVEFVVVSALGLPPAAVI